MENTKTNMEVKMADLFFKSIKFDQIRGAQGQIQIDIKHKFEVAKSYDKKNVKFTVTTKVADKEGRIELELQTVAIFIVEDNTSLPMGFNQFMLNAIYPSIRTEVLLLTTQPGILPIQLPLMPPRMSDNPDEKQGSIFA